MKKFLFPLAFALASCGNQDASDSENSTAASNNEGFSKEIEYAVDANGMFHTDLNDDDFSDISNLMVQLLNDVLAGKLQALDPMTEQPMTLEEVRAKLFVTDTVYFENPETGLMEADATTRDFGSKFYSVKFRERWKYAPDGGIIERKVVAIAPRIPVYSSMGGDLRGHTSLFWVKVN